MPHKSTFRRPFSPQKSLQNKNATRHESRLNALLCAQPIDEHPSLFWASYPKELYMTEP